jgi:hypothetical protein
MPDIFVAQEKEEKKPTQSKDGRIQAKLESDVKKDTELKTKENRVGVMSTFTVEPSDVSFADQEPGERVLLFLRRHLVTNLDWLILTLLFASLPLIFFLLNGLFGTDFLGFLNIPERFVIFFLLFYYSAVFTFALANYISWFYNVGLVTTRRVIDIDLLELIFKNVATTKFELIQDASYVQNGAVRALFHFGDVHIQTAGQHGYFELEAVPHPDKVVHLIEDFIGTEKENI